MAKYRHNLPQLKSGDFLTDGGLETTLVFHRGIDLPAFAAFPLLDDRKGREELTEYYETYLAIARERGLGFILDTPTWRANADWGPQLGYDIETLREINIRSVDFIAELRKAWEKPGAPVVLNGVIGPRGDGYRDGNMDPLAAEDYHAFQAEAFAASQADMISAITMNNIGEAVGITRAAKRVGMPCVVSFTVETDGRLVNGKTLQAAIEETDAATDGYAAYYMVNCAHPSHFEDALSRGEAWVKRIAGIRANASVKSHQELDEAPELDIGDPLDLGARYRTLRKNYPGMRVLGGCCGTDHRHLQAICDACLPAAAA
ncbi:MULTISPECIES: homocysteine S-methyltransferase family protein [Rhizobium/Agrobacterium group]|uniref:Homocysteine S-methyltransferase family protein n=2 Tax=Neorhizobium TaxID=1525371 RepID=A0ABV0MCD6_9HYPH|nr:MULTISPECIES: homocysteine S-methyltransferase family protein [Rhizobium/Agrobacterium group]KGD98578.1 homocysteine methyltransferase [Rhizobium sp. YS-1r]MCC2609687.1 homocysteine S-methyltransferase family protein [Neorhizobium petrolearium]WGI69884.1 homocysteine S-methyltransferase family protein [Neorhizobium petrolearium]